MSIHRSTAVFAFMFLMMPAMATEIYGTISLESKRRLGDVSVTNTIIFYRPDNSDHLTPGEEWQKPAVPPSMTMEMKMFAPTVLNVDVGTVIDFPNADRVIHNAFSTTKGSEFDLGFYAQGEQRSWQFDKPGLVTVFCNVHPDMVGYVMVLDTPYHTTPAADGTYSMKDLPVGTGKLYFWHPRGRTVSRSVQVEYSPSEYDIAMRLTKRLVPNHKNKFGKPYRRSRDY